MSYKSLQKHSYCPRFRVIFSVKDENTFLYPVGISTDQHQNIVECNTTNHNLILIAKDGDKHEILYSKDDGLSYPR